METEARFGRFKDALWLPSTEGLRDVIVGGAGGIGSWLTLMLARAGFIPTVYDFDTIEAHNIGGQLFRTKDIGKSKVGALSEIVAESAGTELITMNQRYDESSMSGGYVFAAFDNMKARKDLLENWYRYMKENPEARASGIFIDGRLTMDQASIFIATGKDHSTAVRYKKFLFDDADVPDAPCTMRQTSHGAALIASHMLAFFTNHLTNLKMGAEVYKVPFFWEYFIPLNMVNDTPNEP